MIVRLLIVLLMLMIPISAIAQQAQPSFEDKLYLLAREEAKELEVLKQKQQVLDSTISALTDANVWWTKCIIDSVCVKWVNKQ